MCIFGTSSFGSRFLRFPVALCCQVQILLMVAQAASDCGPAGSKVTVHPWFDGQLQLGHLSMFWFWTRGKHASPRSDG